MTTIYLAYPIDLSENDIDLLAEVCFVSECLTEAGFMVYEPGSAFSVPKGALPDPTLQMINNEALRLCSAVVALFPSRCRSVGVPMECERAAQMGLPVLVVRDHPSWALAGMHNNIYQFAEWQPAFKALLTMEGEGRLAPGKPKVRPEPVHETPTDVACFQALWEPVLMPTKAYADDAGWDLYFNPEDPKVQGVTILPGEYLDLDAGVAIQWPPGYWGFLVGRSSTFRNLGLVVNPGIIDPGYRGRLCALVRNISNNAVRISAGDRIAQIIPIPAFQFKTLEVDALAPSERGTNGWGSSGR